MRLGSFYCELARQQPQRPWAGRLRRQRPTVRTMASAESLVRTLSNYLYNLLHIFNEFMSNYCGIYSLALLQYLYLAISMHAERVPGRLKGRHPAAQPMQRRIGQRGIGLRLHRLLHRIRLLPHLSQQRRRRHPRCARDAHAAWGPAPAHGGTVAARERWR